MPAPQRTVLLARISDARGDETAGVDDQVRALTAHAARLGWGVGRVIVENDTSAFQRKTVVLPDGRKVLRVYRPGFREALDDLASGAADGLLAVDLDRVCRDPRDLEDLIDVVESRTPRLPVSSITGSLRLGSDADVTMARVMVAMGNKSSRDTGRRVAAARLRQASAGRFGGGRRRFGYEPDGVTIRESEANELRNVTDALLGGASLRSVTADLRRRQVPTVTGVPWTSNTLRDILLRPRTAGLAVYRGSIIEPEAGKPSAWPAIVPRDQWEAVCGVLTDPSRRTTPGGTPRWLGSLIYRCGHVDCTDLDPRPVLRVSTSGNRPRPAYKCFHSAHLVRVAPPIDDFVTRVLIARLERPDAADLVAPPVPQAVAEDLAGEATALRTRIAEAGNLWEAGDMPTSEYRVRTARLRERLAVVEARQRDGAVRGPLVALAGNPDAAKVWAALDLGRRRVVLDTLATVTILPAPTKGRRAFDSNQVQILWKDGAE